MKKFLTLSALTMFLLTASLNVVNAAFPKDKQTTQATTVSTATTASASENVVTKKVVKTELKKALKHSGSKSKIVAALLAFFLGGFGVHSFYMGNKKKGFMQLGGTILGTILLIVGAAKSVSAVAAVGTTAAVSASISPLLIIGAILLIGVSIWAFVDFIRILTGGLAPEEGFND